VGGGGASMGKHSQGGKALRRKGRRSGKLEEYSKLQQHNYIKKQELQTEREGEHRGCRGNK